MSGTDDWTEVRAQRRWIQSSRIIRFYDRPSMFHDRKLQACVNLPLSGRSLSYPNTRLPVALGEMNTPNERTGVPPYLVTMNARAVRRSVI